MAEQSSAADRWLDRISKIASICVPILLGWYAQVYTAHKDASDRQAQLTQQARDDYQKTFDNASRRYQNLVALMPLLTSKDRDTVLSGLEVFASEAKANQAPTDLGATLDRIGKTLGVGTQGAVVKQAAQEAQTAVATQIARDRCFALPDGIYIHVVNDAAQRTAWESLGRGLASAALPVQGVQRVDQSPDRTQIRYYATSQNKNTVEALKGKLNQMGIAGVEEADLTKRYLGAGCAAPQIFEVWIGKNDLFTSDGSRLPAR